MCICIVDYKIGCSERRLDLMEIEILKGNKENVFLRLFVIIIVFERVDCIF